MGAFADPRTQIGQRIRDARQRRKMTQVQLAHRLGIASTQLQRYEHGRTLTLDRLVAIAEALQLEPTALLNLTDPWSLGAQLGFYGREAKAKTFDADPEVKTMCGLPTEAPSSLCWEGWYKRIHAGDRRGVDAQLARLSDPHDGVFEMRYRLIGHDGILRTILDRGHMIFSQGSPKRLQGVMLDITDAVKAYR